MAPLKKVSLSTEHINNYLQAHPQKKIKHLGLVFGSSEADEPIQDLRSGDSLDKIMTEATNMMLDKTKELQGTHIFNMNYKINETRQIIVTGDAYKLG